MGRTIWDSELGCAIYNEWVGAIPERRKQATIHTWYIHTSFILLNCVCMHVFIRLWADKFEIEEKEVVEICESLEGRKGWKGGEAGVRAAISHFRYCQRFNLLILFYILSVGIMVVFVFNYLNCLVSNGRYSYISRNFSIWNNVRM